MGVSTANLAYLAGNRIFCCVMYDYKDYILDEQVDVGDFLRLKSCVLYTEVENPDQPLINIEVVAHVTRPELRSSEVSP